MEPIDVGMRTGVEIEEGAARNQVFSSTFPGRKEKGNVGNLFGQNVDGAIDPDNLLVSVGKDGGGIVGILTAQPGGGKRFLHWCRAGASDVEA